MIQISERPKTVIFQLGNPLRIIEGTRLAADRDRLEGGKLAGFEAKTGRSLLLESCWHWIDSPDPLCPDPLKGQGKGGFFHLRLPPCGTSPTLHFFFRHGPGVHVPLDNLETANAQGSTGWDGNSSLEVQYIRAAHFLVDHLDRFHQFKGRDFNAHMPTLDAIGPCSLYSNRS